MNNYNFETDTITYKDHIIENFFKDFPQQDYIKDYVRDNLMMLCVGGSHAYGLDTEESDLDIRGMFKDNIDQLLGLERIEQLQASNNDVTEVLWNHEFKISRQEARYNHAREMLSVRNKNM